MMPASGVPVWVSKVNCFHPPAVEIEAKFVAISKSGLNANAVFENAPARTNEPLGTVVTPPSKVTVRAPGTPLHVTVVAEAVNEDTIKMALSRTVEFFI